MPSTYDPKTNPGKVRLLISDVGGSDGSSFLFEDVEIETFLEMENTVRLAAASALRTIAGNEAQVQKRITFLELKTDGPAVAKELLALAKRLEEREEEATDDDVILDFAQMGVDAFSRRDLHDQYARKLGG